MRAVAGPLQRTYIVDCRLEWFCWCVCDCSLHLSAANLTCHTLPSAPAAGHVTYRVARVRLFGNRLAFEPSVANRDVLLEEMQMLKDVYSVRPAGPGCRERGRAGNGHVRRAASRAD